MKRTILFLESASVRIRLLMAGCIAAACFTGIADDVGVSGGLGSGTSTALVITHSECGRGCVTIDFETPEPLRRHGLEESLDLRNWHPVPIATFEKRQAPALRTVLAGVTVQTAFYRVVLPEVSGTNPPDNYSEESIMLAKILRLRVCSVFQDLLVWQRAVWSQTVRPLECNIR